MKRSTWGELFDLDGEGPARPLEDAEAEALIAGALDGWAGSPSAGGATAGKGAAWWATAAAVMLVAGAATAAMVLQGPAEDPSESETAPAAGDPDIEEPSFPQPVEIHSEGVDEESVPQRRRRRAPERSPDDLLQEANRLRGQRRWGDAERTYLEVTSAYPGTHAAYVAQVAAANIRLERLNRAGPAARLFRAAIRSGGPLDPEARDGLARALHRTGDRSGERRALEGLLERHPRSAYASRARARLAELEAAASR